MKKSYKKSSLLACLLTVVCSLLLGGCFQNDGYIGVYFGSWVIETIEIDGEKDRAYNGHTMISFQSSFFEMSEAGGGGVIQGIWKENGDVLMLHGAEETAKQFDKDDNPVFPLSTGLGSGLDNDLVIYFNIEKKTSKRMVWTRTDSEGRTWRYSLRHLL